jgi:hypothetical protein
VDPFQGREPLPVVASEVLVEALSSVSIPKNSPTISMVRDLGVGKFGRRAALA